MPAYKDSNGSWYYAYKKRDPVTGDWKNIKKRGFKTRREALAAEREAMSSGSSSSSTTFREMAKLWEDYTGASESVRTMHRQHFKYRFAEYMDMPVESLTKPILSRYRANLQKDERWSTTTKNSAITVIKGVLRFAHEIYDLPDYSSVLSHIKETDEEALQEMEVWTPEEFDQFIQAVDLPLYKILYSFMFWTGVRRGEAIALQKEDIGEHTATIRHSQITQKAGLKPTKTRRARTIQLDDKLFTQLQPLLKQPGNYVFGGEEGLSPDMVREYFRRGIKKSGVKEIRLHDLRHSHATWLINNGVNIVAVSRRLGHRDVSTTLNTYTHLLESSDNHMMEKINSFKNR